MENKTKYFFSELILSNRDIDINDKIFLENIALKYEWFTMSKILLMKHYKQSSEKYEEIKESISLNLLSCSYYDLQNGTVKQKRITIPEIDGNMSIIDDFLAKNITKINISESCDEYIDIKDTESDVVLEEMANFLAKQKENKQAIEIYTKLSLKFPEKSVYFADVIEKLQKEI